MFIPGVPEAAIDVYQESKSPVLNSVAVPTPVAVEVLLAIETLRALTLCATPTAESGVKSIFILDPSM